MISLFHKHEPGYIMDDADEICFISGINNTCFMFVNDL